MTWMVILFCSTNNIILDKFIFLSLSIIVCIYPSQKCLYWRGRGSEDYARQLFFNRGFINALYIILLTFYYWSIKYWCLWFYIILYFICADNDCLRWLAVYTTTTRHNIDHCESSREAGGGDKLNDSIVF